VQALSERSVRRTDEVRTALVLCYCGKLEASLVAAAAAPSDSSQYYCMTSYRSSPHHNFDHYVICSRYSCYLSFACLY